MKIAFKNEDSQKLKKKHIFSHFSTPKIDSADQNTPWFRMTHLKNFKLKPDDHDLLQM